jgi:hypothetical protein
MQRHCHFKSMSAKELGEQKYQGLTIKSDRQPLILG